MLQVGFGVGDVTPDAGTEMPGGFFKRKGTGALDKLLAVACVVHDGERTAALVGLDTLFITRPTVEAARRHPHYQAPLPSMASCKLAQAWATAWAQSTGPGFLVSMTPARVHPTPLP